MRETPTRTGGIPSTPVTLMIPLAAWSSGSYPGWSRSGPVDPNAPIEQ